MIRFTIPCKAALLALALVMLGAAPATAQPDDILIDNAKAYTAKTKASVRFNHGAHMAALDCLDCHHRMQKGKNVLDPSMLEEKAKGVRCADCHAVPGSRVLPDTDPSVRGLRMAYHGQCLACHQKMASQGKKTGARTCAGCHSLTKAKAGS